ncbi:MAG: hypothetical protein K5697_15540 [Lachnospiraceae bacterium]|nr:hypothetical protein [Lachnospiraceae bacterium]
MPNLQFSVNKDSRNLKMANEFMRFLITTPELNEMTRNKGLMSPTKDLSFNSSTPLSETFRNPGPCRRK